MNAQRNSATADGDTSLRDRAAALRAATGTRRATREPFYSNPRSYAERFDFSAFTVVDVARLYEVVKQLDIYLGHISNMPLCIKIGPGDFPTLSPVGRFIDFEESRITFLRDRCVSEIARRTPLTKQERDEILSVRISHALDCGGSLDAEDEPGLLIEALKAWG